MDKTYYFLTVDWCNKGKRGIFCDANGCSFHKDDMPHSTSEMDEILGVFSIILSPKSELYTIEEIAEFTFWQPLGEYSNHYGIALKQEDVPIKNHDV